MPETEGVCVTVGLPVLLGVPVDELVPVKLPVLLGVPVEELVAVKLPV